MQLRYVLAFAVAVSALTCATPTLGAVNCSVNAMPVAFGVYDPLAMTALYSTGTVQLTCDLTSPPDEQSLAYSIQLSAGGSGAFAGRYMQSGPARLNYNLYRDSAATQVWGDGTSGSLPVDGTLNLTAGSASSASVPVYGRATAAQDVTAGSYSDTITITVIF